MGHPDLAGQGLIHAARTTHCRARHRSAWPAALFVLGGGLMKGKFMLQGWKNMNPEQHCVEDHIDLYGHIDDPVYLRKEETFAS